MNHSVRGAIIAGALSLAVGAPALGQSGEGQSADSVIASVSATLSGAQSFSVHVEKTFEVVMLRGGKIMHSGAMDVAVRRPDRFYVSYGDDMTAGELWYDGKLVTMQDYVHKVHTAILGGETIAETIDILSERYDNNLPLGELISGDGYERYAEVAEDALFLGEREVDGQLAHHVYFQGDVADWQIWVSAAEPRVPLKMVVTRTDVEERPQQVFRFSEWNLSAELPDGVFEAEIAEGSSKAAALEVELIAE